MAVIILAMDVSCGERRIRDALDDVDGIDDVQVFEDTNRVVVTGCAEVEEVVAKLTRRLRIRYGDLTIVSSQEPRLELSSDEEGDDDDDDDDGECFRAARINEPSSEDQPVPDPSSWFGNFNIRRR